MEDKDKLSRLAAYGILIDAQRYLRLSLQPNGGALALLRQAEDKLRVELWTRTGFGNN